MSSAVKCPEPGVYRDVPMATYQAWPAASNSQLTHLMKSPAHLAAYRRQPPKETPALKLGTAIHSRILEPDDFRDTYVQATQCAAKTKGGKGPRCSKEGTWPTKDGSLLCTQHLSDETPVDKATIVLSESDFAMVEAVGEAVHAHGRAGRLLAEATDVELSIVWDDPVTGVRCKARLDAYAGHLDGGTIPDLKSAVDGGILDFERAVLKWGYHRKAWFYLRGAKEVGLPAEHFPVIVIEKDDPYAVDTYRISSGVVTYLEDQMSALLELYAECLALDDWPGRPERIRDISIPDWGWKKIDEETEGVREQLAYVRSLRAHTTRGAA